MPIREEQAMVHGVARAPRRGIGPATGASPWIHASERNRGGGAGPRAVVTGDPFGSPGEAVRPDDAGSRRRAVRPFLETYSRLRGSGMPPRKAREAMLRAHHPDDPGFVEAAIRSFDLAFRPPEKERRTMVKVAVALSVLLEGEPPSLVDLRREMAKEVRRYRLPGEAETSSLDFSGGDGPDLDFDFDGD